MNRSMEAPGVGVAAILVESDTVLLVRRRNSPAQGLWAFPGGRVELGETLHDAVQRELLEECNLVVNVLHLVDVIEATERQGDGLSHWVLPIFRVERTSGEATPGDDAAEIRWVARDGLDLLPTAPGVVDLADSALSRP